MKDYSTLVNLLRDRVQEAGDRIAYRFLKDGEIEAGSLTYQQLDRQARAIAVYLTSLNLLGSRAVIIYPYDQGLEFISTFFGCLYAGVVAVTCHPPLSRHAYHDIQARLAASQASAIITDSSLLRSLRTHLILPEQTFHWIDSTVIPDDLANDWSEPNINSDSLAFLQYTSGSTGTPKGVMITHESILYNQQMLKLAFGHSDHSIGVGWLPLFHDMGLIGKVIQALYVGRPSIFMSPVAFIQKPIRWLQAISHYQATTSGGPNFAYDLLCRHVTPQQREKLDLSSWEVAFSGAEPIRVETIERFCQLFSPCGFRCEAFYSCYGMAEATLLITGGSKEKPPVIEYVSEIDLEKHRVVTAKTQKTGFYPMVGCGQAWLDEKIAIVDPQTLTRCLPNQVGEIWVAGSGLGKGYWNDPQRTDETFRALIKNTGEGPFLRTGDLGFWQAGELFVTGRLHDVIVFWGINHYPQLIEQTVESCHQALRRNGTAAFSVEIAKETRLIIAQEVERSYRHSLDIDEIVETVRWKVFEKHLVDVYAIILLKPGSLPKTSSGKIQRSVCKVKFFEESWDVLGQWCCSPQQAMDMTSIFKHYFNPVTHLKRYLILTKAKVKRLLK